MAKKEVCVWLTLSGCGKFIAKDKWYGGGRWKMLIPASSLCEGRDAQVKR